ncbi:MAG TPA: hypothetical protein VFR24_12760 [Candidatus Angelobacter sp.]|jgi:hypothetical protein|nr:hypothetical protein [Candidatus Angelobacter sp.]
MFSEIGGGIAQPKVLAGIDSDPNLNFAVAWLIKGKVIFKDEKDQTSISSPPKSAADSSS